MKKILWILGILSMLLIAACQQPTIPKPTPSLEPTPIEGGTFKSCNERDLNSCEIDNSCKIFYSEQDSINQFKQRNPKLQSCDFGTDNSCSEERCSSSDGIWYGQGCECPMRSVGWTKGFGCDYLNFIQSVQKTGCYPKDYLANRPQ